MHCILRDFSWSPKRASIDGRRIPSGNVLVGADWHGLCGKDSGWMPVGMEKMRQLYFARDTGCFPSDLRPWLAIMNQNRWVCPAVSKAAKAGTTASRCAGHLATNNGCCGSELHKPGSRGKVTISWHWGHIICIQDLTCEKTLVPGQSGESAGRVGGPELCHAVGCVYHCVPQPFGSGLRA